MLQRISSRADFAQALQKQALARTTHFSLHAQDLGADDTSRIGCVVPKRWAKRAVTRNLIKRQVYMAAEKGEVWHRIPHNLVVRLRFGFEASIFSSASSDTLKRQVRQEMEALFSTAQGKLLASREPS